MYRKVLKKMLVVLITATMFMSNIPMDVFAASEELVLEAQNDEDNTSDSTGKTVESEATELDVEVVDEATAWSSAMRSADPTEAVGMFVTTDKSSVTIDINRVGTKGTAYLYRYDAEDYYLGDDLHGMSKNVSDNGEILCEYECGTTSTVTFNRYFNDGRDTLYSKYYLVQNGKILVGPVYSSEIQSVRSTEPFEQNTKKGLTLEDGSTIEAAKEMGVSNTVINMDLTDLIIKNEDEFGNPIDNSTRSDVIEFESNGEIFYFNGDYVKAQDNLISAYSREGMNVSVVVISWAKTYDGDYPAALLYDMGKETAAQNIAQNAHTMGFNTSTERGREYWIAAMEFMASRYTKSQKCFVDKFIIGNEIDYTYDWYLMQPEKGANGKYQRVEFNTFMEEYARTLRLANLAVKKYNSESKVCISFTHNWAENCLVSYGYGSNNTSNRRYNSYAPKEMFDWLIKYEGGRGNYDWGLAVHPYPIGTTASNPVATDVNRTDYAHPITGDENTSPWITAANLELYQLYLEKPENMYNGELRTVSITETSICADNSKPESLYEQAASIAMYYYRSANIECIDAIAYFQLTDQSTTGKYPLGLMTLDGVKKPAYDVWKYVDTDKTFNYSNQYLKYIANDLKYKVTSYKDIMPAVKSNYNWDLMWDEENIIRREINEGDKNRTLATDKVEYDANEAIMVTASGDSGDRVGLYLASDDVNKVDPIYSYPVVGTNGNTVFKSGSSYDLLAYGELSATRAGEAALKAGQYKVVLKRYDGENPLVVDVTLKGNYSFGGTEFLLDSNKDQYYVGEDIIVTASGQSGSWVGLYKVDDKYGTGETTSIYWYYVNDTGSQTISGKPVVIQNKIHNTDSSNPAAKVAAGEYVLYLFSDSGYNVVKSKKITIVPKELEPLTGITYKLSQEDDGFANGIVVVEKDAENDSATECVMYWADENGNHLEGYTSLAKFKLTGEKTTHKMAMYTVIPEGARKLVAYASDGTSMSDAAVETSLPENCNYRLDEEVLAEFQVISDVHVTTASGAKGEVKLANQHFMQMLEDVKTNSPESIGIFINGDIANTGSGAEYLNVYNMHQQVKNSGEGNLPNLHISIGNHDWMAGNANGQFQKYAKIFNDSLAEKPETVYYDEEIGGYHFIYLGGEEAGLRAVLSKAQLEWFDNRMKEITKEDPNKPVFVLLHQGVYDTVAGTLPGQGWDGVVQETALKNIIKKYGQIIMFAGHSHWELNSESSFYPGDEEMSVALNTASVGYLWSSYNISGGEFADGSHGYYVKVYEDKIVFLGRDFENGLYIPSAMFMVQKNKITTSAEAYSVSMDEAALNFSALATAGGEVVYTSSDPSIASITADGTLIPKKEGIVEIIITSFATDTTVMDRKVIRVKIGDAAVYRIYGQNRYETSFKIADTLKEKLGVEKFENVIISSGKQFADALAGTYLAKVKNAPILICNGKNEADIRDYINKNLEKGGCVYILGGPNAVPEKYGLKLSGYSVRRIAGDTRYETNLEILKYLGVTNEEIIVCTGTSFADSLSASALGKPILLINGNKKDLTVAQKEYLSELAAEKFYIIGGEVAINKELENAIGAYGDVERIGGETRHETSTMIAEKFFDIPEQMVIAFSKNFPDGLCGGVLAATMNAPMILTKTNSEDEAKSYAELNGIKEGIVLGGPGLISNNTVRTIFSMDDSVNIVLK